MKDTLKASTIQNFFYSLFQFKFCTLYVVYILAHCILGREGTARGMQEFPLKLHTTLVQLPGGPRSFEPKERLLVFPLQSNQKQIDVSPSGIFISQL